MKAPPSREAEGSACAVPRAPGVVLFDHPVPRYSYVGRDTRSHNIMVYPRHRWRKLGFPSEEVGIEGPRQAERGRMAKPYCFQTEFCVSGAHKMIGAGLELS